MSRIFWFVSDSGLDSFLDNMRDMVDFIVRLVNILLLLDLLYF